MAPWFGLLSGAEREVGVAGPTVLMGHPHHLFRASIINTLIHRRGGFFGTRILGEIRQKISPFVSVGRTVSLFRFFLGFAQVSEFRAQVRKVTHLGSTNFFSMHRGRLAWLVHRRGSRLLAGGTHAGVSIPTPAVNHLLDRTRLRATARVRFLRPAPAISAAGRLAPR